MTLNDIAKKMCAKGKGILAADESTPTCTKRFESIGVKSTFESRNEYRDMLMTTEANLNLRIKQRVGIVTSDFLFEIPKVSTKELISKFFRKKSRKQSNFFNEAIELAMLELKSKAIRLDANGIIGLQIDYISVGDFAKNGIIISLVGTAVKL